MNPFSIIWKFLDRTYHRLASPREFYGIAQYMTPIFGLLSLALILSGAYLGLFKAPADYQQGDSFRIIYVHVPAAWLSLMVYTIMAVAAAIGMVWRMKMAFVVAICSAPLGAVFTALALITGSIWGKPIWGTWWTWDARLTSELILLFLYFGVMATYHAFEERKTAEKAMAMLSIVGIVIVPIIHYSVEWWSSLHQGATVFAEGGPRMPSDMLTPLLLMIAGFMFFYGYALFLSAQNMVLNNERKSRWVRDLIQNTGDSQ
ncbi:heme ABC transporter permease [Arenicella sp. 4NH20-0111]|uniref:heme ABC transporter permease n=1 Tax=Arenicella sp. 4NH20-0111 TaxID=3127648 RepID=UPI003104FF0D